MVNQSGQDTLIISELPDATALIAIIFNVTNGEFFRMTGFHFQSGTTNANGGGYGNIQVFASQNLDHNSKWRIDHCFFDALSGNAIGIYAFSGLVDNCVSRRELGSAPLLFSLEPNVDAGNMSWANDVAFGTVDEGVYVEGCYFTNSTGASTTDGYDGAKFVFRYNTTDGATVQGHGTESSGIFRSTRWMGVYGNTFNSYTYDSAAAVLFCRGGSGVCFSNTLTSTHWGRILEMTDYRLYANMVPYQIASGTNIWDDNVVTNGTSHPYVYDSGVDNSATGTSNHLFIVDTTKNWTANQWVDYSVVLLAPNLMAGTGTGVGGLIESNNATMIKVWNSLSFPPDLWSTNGQKYEITRVNHSLDQPGVGKGTLIADIGGGWTHEIDEPWYYWGNTGNNADLVGAQGQYTVVAGRNYTNAPRPNYVPLTFPHPFAQIGSTSPTLPPGNLHTVTPP